MLIRLELRVSEVEQLQLLSNKLVAVAALPICHIVTALTYSTICVGSAEQAATRQACSQLTDTSVLLGC